MPNFGHSISNDSSATAEIRQNNMASRVPSFKVIQGYWNREGANRLPMTSDSKHRSIS